MSTHSARCASIVLVVTAALIPVTGCSPMPDLTELTAEDAYQVAEQAAARGDYLVAGEAYKRIIADSPLHDLADDALIGLADVHRALGDYATAEQEYRDLLADYPHSDLVPEAEYKLGLSFYEQSLPAELDQTVTRQAMSQLEYFVDAFPESGFAGEATEKIRDLRSRLAEKSYMGAMLYFTLRKPVAARLSLAALADEYPDTVWARRGLLESARSFAREGSRAMAVETYQRLIDTYPGTGEAEIAATELAQLPE